MHTYSDSVSPCPSCTLSSWERCASNLSSVLSPQATGSTWLYWSEKSSVDILLIHFFYQITIEYKRILQQTYGSWDARDGCSYSLLSLPLLQSEDRCFSSCFCSFLLLFKFFQLKEVIYCLFDIHFPVAIHGEPLSFVKRRNAVRVSVCYRAISGNGTSSTNGASCCHGYA